MSKILVAVMVNQDKIAPGERCITVGMNMGGGEVHFSPAYLAFYNTDNKTWQKVQVIKDGDEILAMAQPSESLGIGDPPSMDAPVRTQ